MINVNQITSKLAMMPDGALKQFAEMHKEDPYSFSLAIAESNRRKQIRSQVPPMQEQPKVADQEISSMTRPPEEVGIGALPVDMNMASGGIIAFDQGGYVPSYSGKKDSAVDVKKVFVDEYGPVAKTVGKELGVDPSILLAQWGMESRWGSSISGIFTSQFSFFRCGAECLGFWCKTFNALSYRLGKSKTGASNLNADYNAARTTRDAVVEANAVAKGLGLEATAVDAAKAAQVAKANKIINVGRTASGLETIPGGIDDRFFGGKDGNKAPKETPEQKAATEKSNASMQAIQEAEDADILATRRAAMKAEDLSKTEKKDVIALAKENAPDSARTKGFNNDDWLQFGLSLMAGTSRYALQNVGTAGMAALAGKKEREKEERAIAAKVLDKTDMTKVIDRLMKDDPKLSYREAYEIFQQGKTNADLIARGIDIKDKAAQTDRATKIATRKAELDKLYPSVLRNSDSPIGKKMAAEYAAQIAALEKEYPPIAGGTVPAAPAATMPLPGAKIVGSRPA